MIFADLLLAPSGQPSASALTQRGPCQADGEVHERGNLLA